MSTPQKPHAQPTFRLLTLGGLSLVAPTGSPVRQQRRRLALLVLVAVARERGVSRDKLITWLSPESSTDAARHSLHQLIYYLRQQIGNEVFAGTDPLRLNRELVASDLLEYEDAIDQGDLVHAANLYKGPFLDGFHIADSAEFDEWAASERARLVNVQADILGRLAAEATALGAHGESVKWTRQLASLDPLSGRAALGLMRALAAAGDAPGALVVARTHETLVRAELGADTDPEIASFADQLQNPVRETPTIRATPVPKQSAVPASVSGPAPLARRRQTRWWIASGVIATAVTAYALLTGTTRSSTESASRLGRDDQIVVADFESASGDSLSARALSEVLRSALSASSAVSVVSRADIDMALQRMQMPVETPLYNRLASDLATRNGYEAVLAGAITRAGSGFVLSTRLMTSSGRELVILSETAQSADALIPAIGRISNRLRRAIGESAAALDSVRPLEQVTTRSLSALRLFTQAQDEVRAGRGGEPSVAELLEAAIDADSTFAMAHRLFGIRLFVDGSLSAGIHQLRLAERFSDHLTEIERLQAMSTLHLVLRDYQRSSDEAQRILMLDSTSLWALNQLGNLDNLMLRFDHGRKVAALRARVDTSGRSHLVDLSIYDGRIDDALAVARRFYTRYRSSTGSPSSAEARRMMAKVHSAAPSYDSAEYYSLKRGDTDPGSPEVLAQIALVRGQFRKAFAAMGVRAWGSETEKAHDPFSFSAESQAALATVIVAADRARAARRLDDVVRDTAYRNLDPADRPISVVVALALAGRTADAQREFAEIERASSADMVLARGPELWIGQGALYLAQNRPKEAIEQFRRAVGSRMFSSEACRICALPWLGRAFEAAMEPDSATIAYERYLSTGDPDRVLPDGVWRAVTLHRLGEIYAQRGDTTRALMRLGEFATLWKDADSELYPQVELAQRHIRLLRVASPR
jgi:DNA-binding SARP family transcriptional activator